MASNLNPNAQAFVPGSSQPSGDNVVTTSGRDGQSGNRRRGRRCRTRDRDRYKSNDPMANERGVMQNMAPVYQQTARKYGQYLGGFTPAQPAYDQYAVPPNPGRFYVAHPVTGPLVAGPPFGPNPQTPHTTQYETEQVYRDGQYFTRQKRVKQRDLGAVYGHGGSDHLPKKYPQPGQEMSVEQAEAERAQLEYYERMMHRGGDTRHPQAHGASAANLAVPQRIAEQGHMSPNDAPPVFPPPNPGRYGQGGSGPW